MYENNESSKKPHEHHIIIHIDKKDYRVEQDNMRGSELYHLGNITAEYSLYRDIKGHRDDELIPNNDTLIYLHNGDHFYSIKNSLNPGSK